MEELCTKDNQTLGSIRNLRLKITPNKTVINKNVSSIKTRNMSLPYIETAKSSNRLHTKHSIFPSRVATPHITNVYIARSRYPLKVCLIHIIMCAFFLYVRVEIWFAMPHSENPHIIHARTTLQQQMDCPYHMRFYYSILYDYYYDGRTPIWKPSPINIIFSSEYFTMGIARGGVGGE